MEINWNCFNLSIADKNIFLLDQVVNVCELELSFLFFKKKSGQLQKINCFFLATQMLISSQITTVATSSRLISINVPRSNKTTEVSIINNIEVHL